MSRYFTRAITVMTPDPEDSARPMQVYDDTRSMTVHEDNLETWTGLYNAKGEEIHRSERVAMGFCAKEGRN